MPAGIEKRRDEKGERERGCLDCVMQGFKSCAKCSICKPVTDAAQRAIQVLKKPFQWTTTRFSPLWLEVTELYFISPLVFFGFLVALRALAGTDDATSTGALVKSIYAAVFDVFKTVEFRLPAFDLPDCGGEPILQCFQRLALSVFQEFPALDWGPENFIQSAKAYTAVNLFASILKTVCTLIGQVATVCSCMREGLPVMEAAPQAVAVQGDSFKDGVFHYVFERYCRPVSSGLQVNKNDEAAAVNDILDDDDGAFTNLFGGDDDEEEQGAEATSSTSEDINAFSVNDSAAV